MHIQKTKEWCVEHRSFSLKITGGYYDPYGEFLEVPSCIARYRRNYSEYAGGWVVTVIEDKGLVKKRFPDNHHGECYKKSLKAAIDWLKGHKETVFVTGRKIHHREKPSKHNKVGIPGISYKETLLKSGLVKLTFLVRCGRKLQQHFVAGYDIVVDSSEFKIQLEKAIQIRDSFLHRYQEENGFKA